MSFCNASLKSLTWYPWRSTPWESRRRSRSTCLSHFTMIDVLLGGPGRAEATVREITEIEEQILEKCGENHRPRAGQHLASGVGRCNSLLRDACGRPIFPGSCHPAKQILSLSFEIRMPEARGMLNVALPAAVSNALLRKLTQQASYRKQPSTADSTSQMRRRLDHCIFPRSWSFPAKPCASRRSCSLETGDILN